MLYPIAKLWERLSCRDDSEHIQAMLRILAGLACGVYVLAIHEYAPAKGMFSLSTQLAVALTIIAVGVLFLAHILLYSNTNHFRRWIGIVFDVTMAGLSILSLGDSGAPVFGMYIWIVIGNGFRYGLPYLYGSATLALLSFYTVAYFSPYYRANYGLLGLGTFLLAVVIPVYLGSLLKALRRNLEAARAADRLKTRFLANVSHDLRTPLNAIIANCELLTEERRANEGLELRDIQEAATTLNKLVSDLLDVAKLEDGRILVKSSPFNLPELLGRLVRMNEPAALENGTRIYLTLAADTPTQVRGDELRLEQVLNNILSNAIKYTENGCIWIHATPDTTGHRNAITGVLLSIRDTGIGIDPNAIDRIFARFEQADNCYARSYSGAGLGLSIAKELVVLMGGSISVESRRDKGSEFKVSLPLPPCAYPSDALTTDYEGVQLVFVCHEEAGQQRWANTFDGRSLPIASFLTEQNIHFGELALCGELSRPTVVIVDAQKLRISPAFLPTFMSQSGFPPSTNFVLLNAPQYWADHQAIQEYRCVSTGAKITDIRRCLNIVLRSTSWFGAERQQSCDLHTYKRSLKGRIVLVADDNELNRRVISNMLHRIRVQVVEACNGQSALERLLNQHIDAAVLDIQMPNLSGIDVIRTVSKLHERNATPLIALTADTTDECQRRCLEAGAIAVLHKPVAMHPLYRELYRSVTSANTAQEKQTLREPLSTHERSEIDYSLLHELTQSAQHPNYMSQLVACFKKDGGKLLGQLRYALRDENMTESRALLHRLKGMSGAIGAYPIATLCHENLMSPDTQLRISANALMKELFRLHRETTKLLDRYLSGLSRTTPYNDAGSMPLHNGVFIPSADPRQCSGNP